MKRIFAVLAALSVLAGASCSKKKPTLDEFLMSNGDESSVAFQTAEIVSTNVKTYRKTVLEVPENMVGANSIITIGSDVYISGIDEEMYAHIWKTDESFSEFTELNMNTKSWQDYAFLARSSDGFCTLTTHFSYDGLPFPTKEEIYNGDSELYRDAERRTYSIERYNTNGTLVSSTDLKFTDEKYYSGEMGSVGFCANPDNTYTVAVSDAFYKFSADGELISSDSIGERLVNNFGMTKSGSILCSVNSTDSSATYRILTVDPVTLRIISETDSQDCYFECIVTGRGDHSAIVSSSYTLYGFSNGKLSKIVDLGSMNIRSDTFACIGEESFIVIDNTGDGVRIYRCDPRSDDELKELRVVKVAGMTGGDFADLADEFNAEHEGEILLDMSYEFTDTIGGSEVHGGKGSLGKEVISSILAGDPPDLVVTSEYVSMQNIAAKGGFADLYKFIDNDPDLSREDFLPNVLSLNEYGGRLCMIPHGFSIQTMVAKTKWTAGAGENWTSAQMDAAIAQMPAGMAFNSDYASEDDYMWNYFFFYSSSYIDYENRKCSFDSPEFITMLKLMKNGPFGKSVDVDQLIDEGREDEYMKLEKEAIMRDESLVTEGFGDYSSYKEMTEMFGDEPFTIVGSPSENGKGGAMHFGYTFGIVEGSEVADAAWEAVKFFLSDRLQKSAAQNGFGGNLDGNSVLVKYQSGDSRFDDYVRSIGKTATYDYKIFDIIQEESAAFLAGEKSAEQVAQIIQSRVSILISEQAY